MTSAGDTTSSEEQATLDALQRRSARACLDRLLPAAFASLPEHHQLTLLALIRRRAAEPAHEQRGAAPPAADKHADPARHALRNELFEQATTGERRLLHRYQDRDWIDEGLARLLAPLPSPDVSTGRPGDAPVGTQRGASVAPSEKEPTLTRSTSLRRLVVGLLLIATAGLIGVLISQSTSPASPERLDLISITARQADALHLTLETTQRIEAEQFFARRLGRRFSVPVLGGASLEGVGTVPLAPSAEVPALRYADGSTGAAITVYALSYALLDRLSPHAQLSPRILSRLQEPGRQTTLASSDRQVVLWRQRDDILLAVASSELAALAPRVQP